MRIVKISDMTDKEKEKWQQQVTSRQKEREESKAKVNLPTTKNTIKLPSANVSLPTANFRDISMQQANKNILPTSTNIAKQNEVQNLQKVDAIDIKAMEQANQYNKSIEHGGKEGFEAIVSNSLNAVPGGVRNVVAGIGNSVTTLSANAVDKVGDVADKIGLSRVKENTDNLYNKIVNTGSYINKKGNYENTVNSQIKNDAVRTVGNVISTVSNMLTHFGIGFATGIPSMASQAVSVGGSSSQEVLDEGGTIDQAGKTGIAKGGASYFIEKLSGGNMLGKGSVDDIATNFIANRFLSKTGRKIASKIYEVGGEIVEENLENGVDMIIDNLINNKNYKFEDWYRQIGDTTKDTFLSTVALNILGLGGNTYNDVEGHIKDIEMQNYLEEAEKIIKKENIKVDLNELANNKNSTQNLQNSQAKIQEQQINQVQDKMAQNGNMEQVNSIVNSNETLYNNMRLGEVKNIPTKDLMLLHNEGGYRNNEQITNLRNSIKQGGITEPIEIYMKHDGTYGIENGNHRLQIANELGIDNIPVKLVDSWENIGLIQDNTETNILNERMRANDRSNSISKTNNNVNEASRSGGRRLYDFNDQSKNRGTTERNVAVPTREPYSNKQKSNIENQGNNREINDTDRGVLKKLIGQDENNISNVPIGENVKARKHYESIIKSNYTTDEAKAIAKDLMGVDTYVPESNNKQLERADERISASGAETELKSLTSRAMTGGNIKADDIAVGERLIQYYSKIGDKANLQEAIRATAMAGTEAGQTVQAMSLLNHQTPQGQAVWLQRSIDKMNKELKRRRGANAEQFNLTPEMSEKIVNSKDTKELQFNLEEVYSELGQQVTKTTAQKIDAWRYFSMLANPRTHIRNIVGNKAMGFMQYGIKNKIAGGIEAVASKINPSMERTHTIVPANKEIKRFAKADIENVADRLGLNENKYNPKSRLENSMRTFKSDIMENTLGKVFEINNNALEAEDGWGLKAGYVKSLSEYMTANKLTPENITDKQLSKARNYAVEQAKEATFHQDSQIASLLNQLSNKNKFSKFTMDAILPFKKTPINVAKSGIDYSPVGLVKSAVYDTAKLRKGDITVNQYIDNVSKGLTGTGIALVGYALASAGIIKASGSDDQDKEKYDDALGKQSYSIKIGDKTYSLDWIAPAGIPFFIGAECYEISKQEDETKSSSNDDNSRYNKIIKSATNILNSFTNAMNPMTEMSMLSGLTSALKSYDGDSAKMLANMGTNGVKSYVNQFVPTALGQIAKTADEYDRSTTSTKTGVLPKAIDTTRTQIMSKIPGLRQMLPAKTDIWGNEQKQADNVVQRALENAVLPYTRKEIKETNVDKAINKLYENIGEASILPKTINKDLTINKQKYIMTSDEYVKYKKEYGSNTYNLLNELVTSNDYKNMTNTQRQLAIEKIYSYAKEKVKIDYAKANKKECETSTLYNTIQDIEAKGGKKSEYLSYIAKTQDMEKDKDKLKVLANSNYSSNTKKAVYTNTIGKKDSTYNMLEKTNIDITEYIKYKIQGFSSDIKDDGTVGGKAISNSKKNKVYNYINNMNITYEQKLLLLGSQYKLTNTERTKVANTINNLPNTTKKEKMDIFGKMQGFTVYKDGHVKW